MRLAHTEYGLALELDENKAMILVIENKRTRMEFVGELYHQWLGDVGGFVLSDDNKILKIQKSAEVILNPFTIDCNNRKVLTKLYQEIQDCGNEDFYSEKESINREIFLLLDKIMQNVPYQVTSALDFDFTDLCKIYHVQIETSGNSLMEQLIDYIKVMSQLCDCKVFFLLNFIVYLTEEERKHLYEFVAYQKIYLILLEFTVPVFVANEMCCIIDKAGCIINIENNGLRHLPDAVFGDNPNEFEV